MKDLEFALLPDCYTFLLQMNMQTTSKFYSSFKSYIYENKDLHSHIKISCCDIDELGQVDRIIKAVGWHGLRNRLAHYYLGRLNLIEESQFFEEKNLVEILEIENRFQKFTVDGYSRLFLVGFYLKILINKKLSVGEGLLHDAQSIVFLEKALMLSKSRTIKVDWLVITLLLLAQQLGEDLLLEKLKTKRCFSILWNELEGARRDSLIKGLMSYGASINDDEFISMELVG
jgi:hypothetical protein